VTNPKIRATGRTGKPDTAENLAGLIDAITEHIADRHSTISDDDGLILALICIVTYFYMDCPVIPYVLISAPGDSGKSTIAKALADLCYSPQILFPTVASLSRFRDSGRHTAIIDEIQRLVNGRNNNDRESLYALFDLGYAPGNIWQVSAPANAGAATIDRDPFFPKIFLGTEPNIFEERTATRCIDINVKPGTLDDQYERAKRQSLRPVNVTAANLKGRLNALANDDALHAAIKAKSGVVTPIQINDYLTIYNREAEIWRTLIAIADRASEEHAKRIRSIIAVRANTEPGHALTQAEIIDGELHKIMRSNQLTMFNWLKGQKIKPLPNGVWPMSDADFGWPRKSFKGRLPEGSLFFDSRVMTAEMRFRTKDFNEICAAIRWKRQDVTRAYRLAGRLIAQKDATRDRSTMCLPFISGHDKDTLVIIDISQWIWPGKVSIPGSHAYSIGKG